MSKLTFSILITLIAFELWVGINFNNDGLTMLIKREISQGNFVGLIMMIISGIKTLTSLFFSIAIANLIKTIFNLNNKQNEHK